MAHAHLRYLNPFPANTGDVLRATARCWSRRSTSASCSLLLRAAYLIDAVGYNRVHGKPFRIQEIVDEAERILGEATR